MDDASYVGRFRKLSDGASGADDFRRELLELMVKTTDASAGRFWNRDPSARWTLGEETDHRRDSPADAPTPESRSPSTPSLPSLDAVWSKRRTLVVDERRSTSVLHPIEPAGESVVELTFADARPRDTQRIRQVLAVAQAAAERRKMFDERRQLQGTLARFSRERRLRDELAACEDSTAVAYTLANDARAMLDADRAGVWLRFGGRLHPAATSGQDAVNERTAVVDELKLVLIEALGSNDAASASLVELDERSTDRPTWTRYRDRFQVRRMYVAPLVTPGAPGVADAGRRELTGAVVVEFFRRSPADTPHSDDAPAETVADCGRELMEIARLGGQTLAIHARTEAGRPGLARRLGRRLGRRGWAAAAIVAAAAALMFVDVPADIAARGVLQPADRRHVFAPSDATVEAVLVAAGDRVEAGQILVRLRSVELDQTIARLQGERASCDERLASINRIRATERRLSMAERREFEMERDDLQARLEAIGEQLALRERERAALNVVAPMSGVVSTSSLQELLNERPVARGHILLTVCRLDGPWELELYVPESDGGRLTDAIARQGDLGVTFSSASEPFADHEARIRAAPLRTQAAPDGGSWLAVRAECGAAHAAYDGGEVVSQIHAGGESLGARLFGGIARVFRHRVLFRWF